MIMMSELLNKHKIISFKVTDYETARVQLIKYNIIPSNNEKSNKVLNGKEYELQNIKLLLEEYISNQIYDVQWIYDDYASYYIISIWDSDISNALNNIIKEE